MIGRRLLRAATPLAMIVIASAHLGTDDVFFAGRAGPYDVRVSIRQQGVVPGLADITVRAGPSGVRHVLVGALRRVGNLGVAPPPDTASLVQGESTVYAAQLWFMTRGAHSVIVTVEGDAGRGEVTVPVVVRATRRIEMTRELGALLAAGGLFLVVGLLTIFGAASRESVLAPDAAPGPADRRRGRLAIGITGLIVCVLLVGGWRWIHSEATAYRARIDRPWSVSATVRPTDRARELTLAITESLWVMRNDPEWLASNNRARRADLIPDHGKMMHMFIVRDQDRSSFAHVHPTRTGDNTFSVPFPPLPAGRYRVYADITHEDGSSQTLAATAEAGEPPAVSPASATGEKGPTARGPALPNAYDPDDAWWTGAASGTSGARLPDGSVVRWTNADVALVAGRDAELVFTVTEPLGAPARLEPYMGMPGHAMLNRDDGSVFMHLHPAGTISIAAQQALARPDSNTGVHTGMAAAEPPGQVRFPFVAPDAGRYRVWLQMKIGGVVRTAAFDAEIR
jgi:hypothetical protein